MSQVRTKRYDDNYIYGSLAYDFSAAEVYEDLPLEEAGSYAAPQKEERTAAEAKAEAMPRSVQSIAPFSILGFVCIAVMVVLMLMSYVRLISISEESVQLEQQISELELQRTRLLIDYESAFNLTEIEDYATGELGMQKPRADQIYYIDGSSPDRAEILDDSGNKTGVLRYFDDLIASLGEYFS